MTTLMTRSSLFTAPLGPLRSTAPVLASAGAAIALLAVITLAERGDEVPLFTVHLVVLLVAAGPAYLLDDTAADVTAVVPRSLLRRRLRIVGSGLLVAATGWGVVVLLLQWRSPSVPLGALTWEAAGLIWTGIAASAVVYQRGVNEPGNQVASGLGLFVVGVLVAQRLLPFAVLITASDDPARIGWWAATMCAAAAIFVIASSPRGLKPINPGGIS